jgi:hypothetical protein
MTCWSLMRRAILDIMEALKGCLATYDSPMQPALMTPLHATANDGIEISFLTVYKPIYV